MKSAAQGLKAGNPALYCNPDSTDVETGPGALPTAEDEPVKAAPSASTAAAKAPAPKLDASTFDIVKATQYGARERVEELVEGGFDVNLPPNRYRTRSVAIVAGYTPERLYSNVPSGSSWRQQRVVESGVYKV